MIAMITGRIRTTASGKVIIETNGIGYEVNMCDNSIAALLKGEEVTLYISTSFSMYEGQSLYGFLNEEEKEIFELFRNFIPSTGAKKALEYLNKAIKSLPDFKNAIREKDSKTLTAMFGFTKKTADKLSESLKDKISCEYQDNARIRPTGELYEKTFNALISLGYRPTDAKESLNSVFSSPSAASLSFEEMVKESLKRLAGKI